MPSGESSTWRQIAGAACPPQPWRNGRGLTRELMRSPSGCSDWTVRISLADITDEGEFSSLPGVRRIFSLVEGDGLSLRLGQYVVDCAPAHEPIEFDGELDCRVERLHGSARALNVMLRGSCTASVRRIYGSSHPSIDPSTRWVAVYAQTALKVTLGADHIQLADAMLAWIERPVHRTGDVPRLSLEPVLQRTGAGLLIQVSDAPV